MSEQAQHIHYTVKGEGKPLLFLHGFLEDHEMWNNIYPKFLVEGFQCILLDLPCHGKSRFHGHECSMKTMANSVDLVLKKIGINEKLYVIGHSMGGYVGLELSQLRSAEIILLHSNFWADSEAKKLDRNRVINIVEKGKKKFIQEAIPNLFAPANREKCQQIINDLIEKASKIPFQEIQAATAGMRDRKSFSINETTDFSLIHGALDPIIPTAMVLKEVKKLKEKTELITLNSVGHMSIWEDEVALIKALKTLLIP